MPKRVRNVDAFPTELPFCMPPLVAGGLEEACQFSVLFFSGTYCKPAVVVGEGRWRSGKREARRRGGEGRQGIKRKSGREHFLQNGSGKIPRKGREKIVVSVMSISA